MTTMRLALPLFGDLVAPRFCFADEVLVAEVSDGSIVSTGQLLLTDAAWPERFTRLASAGVTLLLCGGFNRRLLPVADSHGIRVIWGLAGHSEQIISAYCRGGLEGVQASFGGSHECPRGRGPNASQPGGGRGRRSGTGGAGRRQRQGDLDRRRGRHRGVAGRKS